VRSQVRVTIASESMYRTNCSLHASAVYFGVSATSGFAPAEPLTMARPRHQLGLGSSRSQHTATSTSLARPCVQPSLELPRRTKFGCDRRIAPALQGQDHSINHAATVNRPQGSDMPPLFTRRHVANTCITPVPPSTIKGRDLGRFWARRERRTDSQGRRTHTRHSIARTLLRRLRPRSQVIHAAPRRDLGLAPSLALLVTPYYEHFSVRNTRSVS